MSRSALASFIFCAALAATAACPAAAATAKPVYKVDSVGASIQGRKLTIIVAGAVSSGGWTRAKLVPKTHKAEGNTLEYEFVATPPPPDEAVIQALVPVGITFVTKLPAYGVTEIRIDAQTNSTTAEIGR